MNRHIIVRLRAICGLNNIQGQERLYEELKIASRKLCNMPNIQVIGPLTKPTGNVECYQGTLAAAIERLDIDAITALHNN
jgi:hypothetical protein